MKLATAVVCGILFTPLKGFLRTMLQCNNKDTRRSCIFR